MRFELINYRVSNYLYRKGFKKVSIIFTIINRFLFSCWIPASAIIGKNVKLGYWGLSVVIHHNSRIGDNCLIAQNVTIGRNLGDTEVPVIGNDVYIGAGSVVFGEIIIGDNVIIGSNSVVKKDIPSNCTVVGNPMKVINRNRVKKYWEYD